MLKHHLNIVCDDIWSRLEDSKRLGINQGEETITDNLLLYLAQQKLPDIQILQTPKNLESVKGTDWEWWIGNQADGYLRYAVQAKKLDAKTGRYNSLNHKVGVDSAEEYQHKILEDYASANEAIPLYAFYNHIDKKNYSKNWNCPLDLDHTKLGCTITPLKNVLTAIKTRGYRTFDKIHEFKETVPLRCLAICPNIAFHRGDNNYAYIPKFDQEAKIYESPFGYLSEMGYLNSYKQLPDHLYNHELGYYPKRVMMIDTSGVEFKKRR